MTWFNDEFMGFRAMSLDNGLIRAAVVPDVGGRILQFWLGDHPYLYVSRELAGHLFSADQNWGDGTLASWKNYGGNKTWPAPQGWDGPHQWAGPPDPVLDTGRFQVLESGRMRAVVQSPPDPRTGLQITRDLSLEPGAARARLRRSMRNVSQRRVRWSLWDVTQLECAAPNGSIRAGCWMTIPLNSTSRYPDGYAVLYGASDNPQWRTEHRGLFGIEYAGALGKVGLDSQAGWVAFCDTGDEWMFAHRFSVEPEAQYPDDGATVEVWTQGPGIAAGVDFGQARLGGQFMEMEVLGPLVDLAPGDASSADLEWAVCRCPGPILDVGAAGCTAEPLRLERRGESWRVSGTFGVFVPGRAVLQSGGHVVLERTVNPFSALRLDDAVSLPDTRAPITLDLVDTSGSTWPLAKTA